MTVRELIEDLQKFDKDAKVEFADTYEWFCSQHGYGEPCTHEIEQLYISEYDKSKVIID